MIIILTSNISHMLDCLFKTKSVLLLVKTQKQKRHCHHLKNTFIV